MYMNNPSEANYVPNRHTQKHPGILPKPRRLVPLQPTKTKKADAVRTASNANNTTKVLLESPKSSEKTAKSPKSSDKSPKASEKTPKSSDKSLKAS